MRKCSSGRTARRTSSSTSLLETEFTCRAFMYVWFKHCRLMWIRVFWCFSCAVRCTIRWIRSPWRRWTAWRADLTALWSGETSVALLHPSSQICWCVCESHLCPRVCPSCGMKLNLDYLLETLWEYLALICIYTKKRGGKRTDSKVFHFAFNIQ